MVLSECSYLQIAILRAILLEDSLSSDSNKIASEPDSYLVAISASYLRAPVVQALISHGIPYPHHRILYGSAPHTIWFSTAYYMVQNRILYGPASHTIWSSIAYYMVIIA